MGPLSRAACEVLVRGVNPATHHGTVQQKFLLCRKKLLWAVEPPTRAVRGGGVDPPPPTTTFFTDFQQAPKATGNTGPEIRDPGCLAGSRTAPPPTHRVAGTPRPALGVPSGGGQRQGRRPRRARGLRPGRREAAAPCANPPGGSSFWMFAENQHGGSYFGGFIFPTSFGGATLKVVKHKRTGCERSVRERIVGCILT